METLNEYKVRLWEDEIKRDKSGKIIHHPLNGGYTSLNGRDRFSYGHLTFGGHDLDKSSILEDVKIFYLEFIGEPEETYDREEWADPLRVEVLLRLTSNNRCWYLSIIDGWPMGIGESVTNILGTRLNQAEVKSEKQYGYGYGFIPRQFFEVPNRYLSEIARYFWAEAVPGYPIEGYNMGTGKTEILKQWDARPRDDQLFRDVIDKTFVNFYTFPAEHRYFVFVTNKLNYAELTKIVGLEDLQERAKEMSMGKKSV